MIFFALSFVYPIPLILFLQEGLDVVLVNSTVLVSLFYVILFAALSEQTENHFRLQ